MDEFVEMLVKAKNGDLKSKEELLNMYRHQTGYLPADRPRQ